MYITNFSALFKVGEPSYSSLICMHEIEYREVISNIKYIHVYHIQQTNKQTKEKQDYFHINNLQKNMIQMTGMI